MKKGARSLAFAIALTFVLSALMISAVPARASTVEGGDVLLYNNGTGNASNDWTFYVEKPTYLALDADYWNLTVYGQLSNGSGSAASGSYTIAIHINDGVTNHTVSSTIAVNTSKLTPQYGNISINAVAIAAYTENDSAVFYVTLTHGAVHDFAVGHIIISTDASKGMITGLIGPIIQIVMLMVIVSLMFKMFEKLKVGGK